MVLNSTKQSISRDKGELDDTVIPRIDDLDLPIVVRKGLKLYHAPNWKLCHMIVYSILIELLFLLLIAFMYQPKSMKL